MFRSIRVRVFVSMLIFVMMVMVMVVRQVNIELHALDLGFLFSRGVQVIAVERQLRKFVFELVEINAEIEHRTNKHVATDSAENIKVKCFHFYSFLLVILI